MKYRTGRRLVGNRTAKTRLEETKIAESKFGDDVALYKAVANGLVGQVLAGPLFFKVKTKFHFTISKQ